MKKIIFLSIIIVSLLSCSKTKNVEKSRYAYEEDSFGIVASKAAVNSFDGLYEYSDIAEDSYYENEYNNSTQLEDSFEQKLIKEGNIRIKVSFLDEADLKIESWAKTFGGYISNSQMSKYTYSYTVRIPSNKFDEAMNVIDGFGELVSRSINVDDVSERYYDLSGRLEAKKILQEKYNQYLKKADNMKDLLEVERQLNDVTSDLEYIQGQLKRLSNQIDYSTIYITLEANIPSYNTQRHINGFDFKDFLYDVGDFFVGFFKAIIYIIVFGIPILAILALLFWLCFGKVGLLKKLFARLNGKKKTSKESNLLISTKEKSDELC